MLRPRPAAGWLTEGDVELGRIAVVSVELDNLAHVSTSASAHRAGAQLIEAITQRLRAVTRPRDVVAHVNQERFVLVCRDVPDRAAAEALAERVAMGVAHPSVLVAGVAEVTASIGVALAAAAQERPESVLRARSRPGTTRGAGRRGASRSAEEMPVGDRRGRRARGRAARDELRLHYLPIVSCTTGRVAGFESLVRWDHPERGLLAAGGVPAATPSAPVRSWRSGRGRSSRHVARWRSGTRVRARRSSST